MCNRVGVAGLKIDFFDHEHKAVIDLYERIMKSGRGTQADYLLSWIQQAHGNGADLSEYLG